MEAIIDLPWRIYPASALLAAGSLLALYGAVIQWRGIVMPVRDPDKALTWMRGFRMTVIGLAIAGIAAAWAWHIPFLLALAVIIGAGETFESSIDIFALRRGRRARTAHRPSPGSRAWEQESSRSEPRAQNPETGTQDGSRMESGGQPV